MKENFVKISMMTGKFTRKIFSGIRFSIFGTTDRGNFRTRVVPKNVLSKFHYAKV